MLGIGPPFMQNMPQSAHQQIPTSHLNLAPSSNPQNPGLMLNNAPGPMNPNQQQRYMQMQHAGELRQPRQMPMRQGQPGQPMMGPSGGPVPGGGGAPHMGGLGHSQSMQFNPTMMSQPQGNVAVRRVSSQPQMNQGAGPIGGMSPGVVNSSIGMGGMNPQGNMAQMRQVPQMQHQLRMQNQHHMQSQMSQDMPMPMNRPVGNPGMPGRTGSAQQIMNSLPQPPLLQHPMVPHHQNQFQNPVQIPSQHQQPQIPSPRPGTHSQTHTPNMPMSTPGPSHTPVNRPQMTQDDQSMAFMGFPNTQFPQAHNTPRMPSGQFPSFVPSSTPPMAEIPQPMSTGLGTPGNTTHRTSFHLTPAQQFEQMNTSPDSYGAHFNMPPPSHVPPRPPSQHNPHPPLPQQQQLPQHPHQPHQPQHHHHSPLASDAHMNSHPQRPQSQPQSIPRPPSQQAHAPRTPQLPPGPPAPPGGTRMSLPSHAPPHPGQPMQMPGPGPQPHMQIAPRPPQPPAVPVPSNAAPVAQAPSDTPPSAAAPIPRPPVNNPGGLGSGQGLIRLLQFSGVLAAENKSQKLQLAWWNELIKGYFTPKAIMKFTLWKDNQRNEAKPFEIGVPILPRFFLVTTQSGVKSMTLSLDGARERMFAQGHSIVECVTAIWTYKYNNGYTVTLRGPLTVHVVITAASPQQTPQAPGGYVLKFEDFQFDAHFHEKYIALDAVLGNRLPELPKTPRVRSAPTPTPNGTASHQQQQLEDDKRWEEPRVAIENASIPGEPVNAFGIPQATMRCLELAESVGQMADLISFSTDTSLGPIEALKTFALQIRETQPFHPPLPNNLVNGVNPNPNNAPNSFASMHGNPGVIPAPPSSTLYSSAPPSVTNPSSNPLPLPTTNSPQNPSSSANNSPQKQHKTIPPQQQQQQQQTQGAPSSSGHPPASPAVSSSTTNTNTPAMSNATLKRKQGADTTSPTTVTNDQPPQKRQTRKRRATGANAG
ncbi:Adhesion defective protein 1 [Hypsizygus marmoreus]|uniref:Adhesion defective protein 1 n=1 Tax=Hypsizygus marmoreus TaxID=39966 RepID=A0A369J9C4_HYPMA|nr:Adhesion defective protein 1 [Hypsizygus marmoreus]